MEAIVLGLNKQRGGKRCCLFDLLRLLCCSDTMDLHYYQNSKVQKPITSLGADDGLVFKAWKSKVSLGTMARRI